VSAAASITLAQLDAEAVRRWGLREFVKLAWAQCDTSPLRWNWHMDAMCEYLEAVSRREIRQLVINVPPGSSKSMIASILWPAWVWTFDPEHRWICASHDIDLALKFARKSRGLMESRWFRDRWPHVTFPKDRTASVSAADFSNTRGGSRASWTVPSQKATGSHADTHVIDDPNNPADANARSVVALEATIQWWHETMATRFRDAPRGAKVVVMQRLHEIDLAAEMIRAGATVLCLPMRFEKSHPHAWARDPRTVDGELLDPVRMPEEQVRALETSAQGLGPTQAAAQLQQRPSPKGGGIFKEAYFKRFWTELPKGGTFTISVDCKFKDKQTKSWVVIDVFMSLGPDFYLVDQDRGQYGFLATCNALEAMCVRWPDARKKLVEAKANGPAVVEVMKTVVNGLVEVETGSADKEARAHSCEPVVASGNFILPDPEKARYPDGRVGAPWVRTEWLPEVTTFPNSATNDQVDTMTQFLNDAPRGIEKLKAAMAAAKKELGR
jgi:predicted phage terminase large subunit-like protein